MNDFLREKFGQKVFKVPLNGNFTCPNKDGTKGRGGCIFCSPSGSGDFAGDRAESIKEQFAAIRDTLHEKWPEASYIAYFQANTNTYGPVPVLKRMYDEALRADNKVVGLSIATRPDALDDSILELLETYHEKTYLQVELGLQSIHEETAAKINRGYPLETFNAAVMALRERGINVVVHIINGFPWETEQQMMATVDHLNTLDIQGIKIHMLHIVRNTALARMHEKTPYELLAIDDYVRITTNQIERLDPKIVVQRVTGDASKADLIAPLWTLKKFVVMNEIDKLMRKRDTHQGVSFNR